MNQTQLARIQRIEIHILHVDMPWCYNKAESEEKWYQLVRTIRTKLNLCRLELRINLVDVNVPKSNLNPNSRKGFLDMNQEVLRPLKQLTSLRNLFIYLGYFSDLEAEAEKEIMGSEYDSVAEGKPPEFYDFPS